MRTSATMALLERLDTGSRCEEMGCYEEAVWLITFKDEAVHLCSKHTRMQMRNAGRWEGFLRTTLVP